MSKHVTVADSEEEFKRKLAFCKSREERSPAGNPCWRALDGTLILDPQVGEFNNAVMVGLHWARQNSAKVGGSRDMFLVLADEYLAASDGKQGLELIAAQPGEVREFFTRVKQLCSVEWSNRQALEAVTGELKRITNEWNSSHHSLPSQAATLDRLSTEQKKVTQTLHARLTKKSK